MADAFSLPTSLPPTLPQPFASHFAGADYALNYAVDAMQRGVLFLDVMNQRGNGYLAHLADPVPHVLDFEAELVLDGRTFERPVNYVLVRVIPPEGTVIDAERRPFIVVDPRAGHGPGIGGFKADSQIGVAFKAGHPCYFIGFLPEPMPGQTIEDIVAAEARFIQRVINLHPDAEGKPCVIGNCQAGWSVMMVAALHPELFGPIIVAGSPLSYWAGVRGKNPMRYTGGLLGGSWLTAAMSDLGQGKFDGAWLVQNFENQNPANTLWSKQYNLYANIDTEERRYLDFERWWGGHVTLNGEEIQFIVDELFIGNNLAAGLVKTADGVGIDLRNIRSPIVVFCSESDNITPPQQALGWILDLYESADDIRSLGQTIVYTVHKTAGHLGIFVSGGVARKEYGEFSSNIDLIDTLPPGLYEAIIEKKDDSTENADLVTGNWVMRCEARTLDDIKTLVNANPDDERRFACANKVSQINLALYRTFAQPFVQAMGKMMAVGQTSELHPLKLQYRLFSDMNPFMAPVRAMADTVRANRQSAGASNPFLSVQEIMSDRIVDTLDAWRQMMETASEQMFMAVYGSRALQAAVGIDPDSQVPARKITKSLLHRELTKRRIAEIKSQIETGGPSEAVIRALLYICQQRRDIDERSFEAVRQIRRSHSDMPLDEFKKMFRDQFFMMLLDQPAAVAAIPAMLPDDADIRKAVFQLVRQVVHARGEPSEAEMQRMEEMRELFEGEPARPKPVLHHTQTDRLAS